MLASAARSAPAPAARRAPWLLPSLESAITSALVERGVSRTITRKLLIHASTTIADRIAASDRLRAPISVPAAALADWLAVRGRAPGPLFRRILKGGRVTVGGITTQAVYDVLMRRAAEAGVDDLSPHDLRRTWVGDLLDAGADLATAQQMAGHADVSTTARYDRRGARARRKAADLLHVPYAPPIVLPVRGGDH